MSVLSFGSSRLIKILDYFFGVEDPSLGEQVELVNKPRRTPLKQRNIEINVAWGKVGRNSEKEGCPDRCCLGEGWEKCINLKERDVGIDVAWARVGRMKERNVQINVPWGKVGRNGLGC